MKEVVNAAEKRSTWTEADEKRYTALTEDLSTIDVRIDDIEANEKRRPSLMRRS